MTAPLDVRPPAGVDLVCWDFGDTLVDEMFMRLAPAGVSGWPEAYEAAIRADPSFVDRCDLGDASLSDLIPLLTDALPMEAHQVARHLRAVFHRIEWLPGMRDLVGALHGHVLQAVVTVNPHEFGAMAVACGLDRIVDVIVTSAEVASLSKPVMARRARDLLGRDPDLSTSLLVDNKASNVGEFHAAGGQAIVFAPDAFAATWNELPRRR